MDTTTRRLLGSLVAVGLLLTSACSSDAAGSSDGDPGVDGTEPSEASTTTEPAPDATFPGVAWDVGQPADLGLDPAALDRLAADAEAAGSSCLVVVRDGTVVAEHAWPGPEQEPREAFSATKSLTSTLVGIAADRGDLALEDSASTYLPTWAGTPSEAVTVEDLVANTSGREWSLAIDYGQMLGAEDKTAFAIGLGQDAPPDEVWAYNNSAIQTLSAVLEEATGLPPEDFAEEAVFGPIGMTDSELRTDASGQALTFMGLRTTCLDLARFGHLMLNEGTWDGEEVVSADYVAAATDTSSSELNAGYGYLWWLNKKGTIATPTLASTGVGSQETAPGQMLPGASEDIFWALGFNNQVVAVVPEAGIVAVRMGPKPPDDAPFSYAELTTGVLDAIVEP